MVTPDALVSAIEKAGDAIQDLKTTMARLGERFQAENSALRELLQQQSQVIDRLSKDFYEYAKREAAHTVLMSNLTKATEDLRVATEEQRKGLESVKSELGTDRINTLKITNQADRGLAVQGETISAGKKIGLIILGIIASGVSWVVGQSVQPPKVSYMTVPPGHSAPVAPRESHP